MSNSMGSDFNRESGIVHFDQLNHDMVVYQNDDGIRSIAEIQFKLKELQNKYETLSWDDNVEHTADIWGKIEALRWVLKRLDKL